MDTAWRSHLEALKRFNAWEGRHPRAHRGFADSIAWLAEAWELADRYGPPHDPVRSRQEKAHRLMQLLRALGQARLHR